MKEWKTLYVTWTERGGREWDQRRGKGIEVKNPGDEVERLGEDDRRVVIIF